MKIFLLRRLYLLFFARHPPLVYPTFDESDDFDEEESEESGSGSGLAGTFGTVLRGLLYGAELSLGVMLAEDDD